MDYEIFTAFIAIVVLGTLSGEKWISIKQKLMYIVREIDEIELRRKTFSVSRVGQQFTRPVYPL